MKTAWLFALSALALPTGMQCGSAQDVEPESVERDEAPLMVEQAPAAGCDLKEEDCNCDCAGKEGRAADKVVEQIGQEEFKVIAASDAPRLGPADAPVTIVLFTDYQCPYCARLHHTLSTLRRDYGDRVAIVVRNLPLPMHQNASSAARAALAAGEQGRFESFEKSLYAHQGDLEPTTLESLAGDIGLDQTAFQRALASAELARRVEHDLSLAIRVGARGTPTCFINGKRVVGSQPISVYRELIEAAFASTAQRPN